MTMLSRRKFVRYATACMCCGAISDESLASTPLSQGCFLTKEGYENYRSQRQPVFAVTENLLGSRSSPSTGNFEVDLQLNRAIKTAADILGVNPTFTFFDPDRLRGENELKGMNAFAWPVGILPGTVGLVGFGIMRFRSELYAYDDTGTTVMCIIAHEFGHCIQFERNYWSDVKGLRCEINADFLAGYYLGRRKLSVPKLEFSRATELFERLGRPGNGDPNRDHGNSQERVQAARAGFEAGFDKRMTLNEAINAGWDYIGYRPRQGK